MEEGEGERSYLPTPVGIAQRPRLCVLLQRGLSFGVSGAGVWGLWFEVWGLGFGVLWVGVELSRCCGWFLGVWVVGFGNRGLCQGF